MLVGDVGLVLGDVVGAEHGLDAARRELADRARQEASPRAIASARTT